MSQQTKLIDLVRQKIRLKHYSIRTEESYIGWIKRLVIKKRKRTAVVEDLFL